MARFGILSGLFLCIATAIALFGSPDKAPLFFIPMMLGIPILFFGVVALNPHRRRQALATAATIAGLGCLAGSAQLIHLGTGWGNADAVNLHSTRIVTMMVVVCVAFLASYLWSVFYLPRVAPDRTTRASGPSD